jgi:U6 snRNA-associated Sm-like protein LSm7
MADKKQTDNKNEKKRKESILDLSKYLEKQIRVKFAGEREIYLHSFANVINVILIFRRQRVFGYTERLRPASELGA